MVVVVVGAGEDQCGGDGAPDEGGPCQHDTDQGKGWGGGGGGGLRKGSAWWFKERISVVVVVVVD